MATKKEMPKVDDTVKVPSAVKAAAAAAEAAHKAAYPDQGPKPAEGAPTDGEVTPGVTHTAPGTAAEGGPVEPGAEPAPTPPVQAAEPAPQPVEPKTRDWEKDYKAMEGRFKRADRTTKDLQDQVSQLQNLIMAMQTAPAQQPAEPAPQPTSPKEYITPKDIEEYGEDFVGLAKRAARAEVDAELSDTRNQLNEALETIRKLTNQVDYVGQDVMRTSRERMFSELTAAVPNWKEVNNNQNFLEWLSLTDPMSGLNRHELLKAAFNANESSRVLAFFKGFLAEEAAKHPQLAPAPAPAPAAADDKVPLEELAAPGRAKSVAPPTGPTEKPTYTSAQIQGFFNDVTAGRYRGREEEKQRIERDIFAAGNEGRIVR